MEVLLPFASEGVQGIPDAAEFLHRAAAGGFVALTDKMAALNGIVLFPFYYFNIKQLALLDGKVDVVDNKGKTPLFKASFANRLKVVKLLVDKYHADVNLPDSEVSYIKGLFHIFPYFIFAGKHSSFLCYQKRPY